MHLSKQAQVGYILEPWCNLQVLSYIYYFKIIIVIILLIFEIFYRMGEAQEG